MDRKRSKAVVFESKIQIVVDSSTCLGHLTAKGPYIVVKLKPFLQHTLEASHCPFCADYVEQGNQASS